MRTEQILSADILDIIFENRNKNYGAYNLRKYYANRLSIALGITFLSAAAVIFLFMVFKKEKLKNVEIPETIFVHISEPAIPVEPEAPKPKPLQTKPAIKATSQLYVKNIIITKKETEATALAKNLDSVLISDRTELGLPQNKLLVKDLEPVILTSTSGTTKTLDKETPRLSAEVMPSFPGGIEGLRKFLQKNLQTPEEMELGHIISVKIKFVVGYDGKLKSFETIEDGGTTFNNEVIRVLKKMPEWVPGKSNGENVSVYYTIPVKFTAAE